MSGLLDNEALSVLRRALDGLALRQQVISNNIANLDTPGFKASEVVFESVLREQLERTRPEGFRLVTTHPRHLEGSGGQTGQPVVVTVNGAARPDGNTVDIDREMARLAETQIAYGAATRLVSAKLSLLRSIVTDGRH